jgi:hypothetical protein
VLAACHVACLAAGCGSQHYQDRLEATRQQFAFFAGLDANLAPPWQQSGLSLRVPLGFRLTWQPDTKTAKTAKAAEKPKDAESGKGEDEDGEDEDGEAGPPGGKFFPRELTGLVGVWTAELPADGGTRTGYLYALTNHDLWLDPQRQDEAARFFEVVIDRDLRNVAGLPADYRTRRHWRLPKSDGESYLPERVYSRADFPGIRSEDGAEATLHVLNFKVDDAEVVLLFVVPQGARLTGTPLAGGSSVDPIELTMKTLGAQAERPRRPGEKRPQGTGGF